MSWNDYYKFLLALVVWREARGEGRDGMRAVAHVIQNRVKQGKRWDEVICAKWQFSSISAPGDGMLVQWPDTVKHADTFGAAMEIAEAVMGGADADNTGGAHFYANLSVVAPESSFWKIVKDTANHPQTAVIGHHTFYK